MQALAATYIETGSYREGARLCVEAARAAKGRDPLTLVNSRLELSLLASMAGDHKRALEDLESVAPLAKELAMDHPHLWPLYHNELAVELAALGRILEARKHARIATSSPVAAAYPEWQETAAELQEPERLLLVVPDLRREPEPEPERRRAAKRVPVIIFKIKIF